jgi:hypothetical protein
MLARQRRNRVFIGIIAKRIVLNRVWTLTSPIEIHSRLSLN